MKKELPQGAIWGAGAAAIVIVGLLIYFLRASDPAASGPVPYKKFDYGAHMQDQMQNFNRQPASSSGQPRSSQH